ARPWSDYTEHVALRIAAGKGGASRAIVAALAELSGDDSRLVPLEDMLDHYNAACALWDDLADWKDDLKNGVPSLLLARLLPEGPAGLGEAELPRTIETLKVKVYFGGHAVHLLKVTVRSMEAAAALAPDLPFHSRIDALQRKYAA